MEKEMIGVFFGFSSVVLALIGLAVTIYFNNSKLSRNLNKIIEIQNGVLTVEQAKKISEFHLRDIKKDLDESLKNFGSRILPEAVKTGDKDNVQRHLLNIADSSIGKSRNNISIFLLRGDVRLDYFMEKVNPINGGIIKSVVQAMYEDMEQVFSTENPDFDLVMSKVSLRVDETIRAAKSRIIDGLDELYRK
ncbi:hypothetical protein F9L33_12885 [Amylibacter sp. SFDW26]|uniref:hypothetical protein n=1 Tax=Amylibacter sp. SFDW26 TaxID=2652722 RepID=UPI00126167D2|nr:hypothetical protein [Amylibacter sp. SFDW26]KAB7613482.1 hypothetical protein F9L33_12885 [Amylibacter sp. SFDW26]